ncbi:MAG: recombinase family protein [Rhodospirillales bacterium]|nr:recombinase family protein [Rhodospirillales bacterium]
MPMRAAIYARFSTEHQRDASIADQQRVCRDLATREGWEVVESYEDRAISGATSLRPGYQALLAAARLGQFDVVVAEALDRLSRDQEDVAALFKRLRFAGIHIFTRAEGEISELHVGLKGTMNALFLKDLALKTHRGLRGRVEAGKSAGGLSFRYRAMRALDAKGELIRGDRCIEPGEAAIVRRIFAMFTDGTSPMAIAQALNAESIAGPGGRPWLDTTIRGHAARGTGILRNQLYVGRLVWNRVRFIKDPATGKRVSRVNPAEAWVSEAVPDLRIIDDALWQRAQTRLDAIRTASGADTRERPKFWQHRRSQHLLTGKVFCGCCGGAFAAIGQDYLCGSACKIDPMRRGIGVQN